MSLGINNNLTPNIRNYSYYQQQNAQNRTNNVNNDEQNKNASRENIKVTASNVTKAKQSYSNLDQTSFEYVYSDPKRSKISLAYNSVANYDKREEISNTIGLSIYV